MEYITEGCGRCRLTMDSRDPIDGGMLVKDGGDRAMHLDEIASLKLAELVQRAMQRACSGLSEFIGREIKVQSTSIFLEEAERVSRLYGGEETPVAAIYLRVGGRISGHAVLIFDLESAFSLLDCLYEQPSGTTKEFDALGISALSEVGNITASAFLNELSDTTGLEIMPSPPAFTTDMLGAILNWLAPELFLWESDVLVVKTDFVGSHQTLKGLFLFLPNPGSVEKILLAL